MQIFLSHTSEDKPKVRNLCKRLRDDGFDPWLDEERLLPGQDWNLEIEKALRTSDAILLCFSSLSVIKEGVIQREYKRAMKIQEEKPEGAIFVIPVRLDDCEMPFFIRDLQWMDYPAGYDKLLLALQSKSVVITKRKKSIRIEKDKQVQLILEGNFEEFNETRQDDLISVLAAILHVDSKNIRVLQVSSGSIVLILEMPETAIFSLQELAIKKDFRLKAKRILSVQVEGGKIISLTENREKKSKETILEDRTKKNLSGNIFNVQGDIHIGRDLISGDQTNIFHHNEQITNITTPVQFIEELQKLKDEIGRMKTQADVDPVVVRRMEVVQADIQDAISEAKKDKPVAKRINTTLDGAKETMEKLGGSIGSAISLGTILGNLAVTALKLFGGR